MAEQFSKNVVESSGDVMTLADGFYWVRDMRHDVGAETIVRVKCGKVFGLLGYATYDDDSVEELLGGSNPPFKLIGEVQRG